MFGSYVRPRKLGAHKQKVSLKKYLRHVNSKEETPCTAECSLSLKTNISKTMDNPSAVGYSESKTELSNPSLKA